MPRCEAFSSCKNDMLPATHLSIAGNRLQKAICQFLVRTGDSIVSRMAAPNCRRTENNVSDKKRMEVWFVTGSQHLYGPAALAKVAENSSTIAASLGGESALPVHVVWKPVLTTADEILHLCREASRNSACVGLVLWMHTFSPA